MKTRFAKTTLMLLCITLLCMSSVSASIIYVGTTGSDNNDGASWASAKRTVQASINVAGSGDEIWVAAGSYNECIILKDGVGVYGGFAGTETLRSQRNWKTNISILDGQNLASSVVTAPVDTTRSCVIDGFTIRNGDPWDEGSLYKYGGGIYCDILSAPQITNNTITYNYATYGAGIYCGDSSSPLIAYNKISYNTAHSDGGGIYCYYCTADIYCNELSNNSGVHDGAIYCYADSSKVTNNTITANWPELLGSQVYCYESSAIVINNIVAFSGNIDTKGIYAEGTAIPALSHNCVFGNAGGNYLGIAPGVGDISVDPLFVDHSGGDYHLYFNSPCISAGDSGVVQQWMTDIDGQTRVIGSGVDIGADEYCYPATTAYSISQAKQSGDYTPVQIESAVVTVVFPDYFYIENDDRSIGIRVVEAGHTVALGHRVTLAGIIETNSDGERYIDASQVTEAGSGTVDPIDMSNSAVGGGDYSYDPVTGAGQIGVTGAAGASNIGLLIRTSGSFSYLNKSEFIIDDGTGAPVKCVVRPGVRVNPYWSSVRVTGASSCQRTGNDIHRLICVRDLDNIQLTNYNASITINASNVKSQINPLLFGNNLKWSNLGDMVKQEQNNTFNYQPQILDLMQNLNVSIMRLNPGEGYYTYNNVPGNFRWRYTVGPPSSRRDMMTWWKYSAKAVGGIDEWATLCKQLGSGMLIAINYGAGAQEAANLVAYCNAPVPTPLPDPFVWSETTYPNGDEVSPPGYWAWLRYKFARDRGVPEEEALKPYGVKYWEIGNEVYCMYTSGYMRWWDANPPFLTATQYGQAISQFKSSMKNVDGSIRIGADIQCADYPIPGWNDDVLSVAANDIDFASVHYYSSLSSVEYETFTIGWDEQNCTASTRTHRFDADGDYTFKVVARANYIPEYYNGIRMADVLVYPQSVGKAHYDLKIDGVVKDTVYVDRYPGVYESTVHVDEKGDHAVSIVYDNDWNVVFKDGVLTEDQDYPERYHPELANMPSYYKGRDLFLYNVTVRSAGTPETYLFYPRDTEYQLLLNDYNVYSGHIDALKAKLNQYSPGKAIDIMVTEGGLGYSQQRYGSPDPKNEVNHPLRFKSAFWLSSFLNLLMDKQISSYMHWNLMDAGYYGVIRAPIHTANSSGTPTVTPVYHLLRMYSSLAGGDLLDLSVNCPTSGEYTGVYVPCRSTTTQLGWDAPNQFTPTPGKCLYSVAARTGNTIRLIISNCSPKTALTTINTMGMDILPTAEVTTLSVQELRYRPDQVVDGMDPECEAFNDTRAVDSGSGTNVEPDVVSTNSSIISVQNSFEYAFAPYTITLIEMHTPVSVTINQASDQPDPAISGSINFTATFNEPVTDFDDPTDVFVSGTAQGEKHIQITPVGTDGKSYEVTVTGMTSSGTVIATIPAGAALDITGTGNVESSSTDNCVTYDDSIIYIKWNAQGTGDGRSWANAFTSLQSGVSAAGSGKEIWVAAGTYMGPFTLKADVAIYGGFAGTETCRSQRNFINNQTILDGNSQGSVVTVPVNASRTTTIDGFVIRNGSGTPVVINGNTAYSGGGIYCKGASPTVSNNVIMENTVLHCGGGIYCEGGSPVIDCNYISPNMAQNGGGIYCEGGSPIITNNSIIDNYTDFGRMGGGIHLVYCSGGKVSGNLIRGNYSDGGAGGGIYSGSCTALSIYSNMIESNVALVGAGIYGSSGSILNNTIRYNFAYSNGGGVCISSGSTTIANNLIVGNTSINEGGGVSNTSSGFVKIINNTIADNSATNGGGVASNGPASVYNNIIAFNSSGLWLIGTLSRGNNCVYSNTDYDYLGDGPGINDIAVDPLFVDRTVGNYHLTGNSLCRDAGNNDTINNTALPTPPGWTDIDGQTRPMGTHVDIGSDEYAP